MSFLPSGAFQDFSRHEGSLYFANRLAHPGVHEDEVHLGEGEDDLEHRVDPPDRLEDGRIQGTCWYNHLVIRICS